MTTTLTTRETAGTGATVKGSTLSNAEVDNNFISLNDNKAELSITVQKDSDTGAAQLPSGTEAQRPDGSQGQLRFNTEAVSFEGHNGTEWGAIGGGGGGSVVSATASENIYAGDPVSISLDDNTISKSGIVTLAAGASTVLEDSTTTNLSYNARNIVAVDTATGTAVQVACGTTPNTYEGRLPVLYIGSMVGQDTVFSALQELADPDITTQVFQTTPMISCDDAGRFVIVVNDTTPLVYVVKIINGEPSILSKTTIDIGGSWGQASITYDSNEDIFLTVFGQNGAYPRCVPFKVSKADNSITVGTRFYATTEDTYLKNFTICYNSKYSTYFVTYLNYYNSVVIRALRYSTLDSFIGVTSTSVGSNSNCYPNIEVNQTTGSTVVTFLSSSRYLYIYQLNLTGITAEGYVTSFSTSYVDMQALTYSSSYPAIDQTTGNLSVTIKPSSGTPKYYTTYFYTYNIDTNTYTYSSNLNGPAYAKATDYAEYTTIVHISPEVILIAGASSPSNLNKIYAVHQDLSYDNRDKFIGIASQDIPVGTAGDVVAMGGVSSTHTGLASGISYFIEEDGSLSTKIGGSKAGKAISSTELLVSADMSTTELDEYFGSLL